MDAASDAVDADGHLGLLHERHCGKRLSRSGVCLDIWHPMVVVDGVPIAVTKPVPGPGVGQAWATTRTVSSKTTPPTSSTGTV